MQNRRHVIIVAALLMLGCLGRSQIPEAPELDGLLFPADRKSRDELEQNAGFYTDFLNENRVKILRAFIAKVGANVPERTVNELGAAATALNLLSVAKVPGLVEAAVPFMQTPHVFVNEIAAEVMAATGSEAAVEHLEAAFQRNMKDWLSGNPLAITKIGASVRCFAINGTPKARAAYDRSISQVAEAAKTGTEYERKWERKHIANAWQDVDKEKRGKGLPDPGDARRVGPAAPRDQTNRDAFGNDASKANAPTPVATVGKAGESRSLPGAWALWGVIAAALVVIAALALKRRAS